MDRAKLGERLRSARSAAGLTQQQAAEKLRVARTTLVAIERGDREVRPEELVDLAEMYGSSVHSLLRPTAVRVDIVGQFRKRHNEDQVDSHAVSALSLLRDLAGGCVELERQLQKVSTSNYPAERKLGRGRLDVQAAEMAAELRSKLGIGVGPIPDLVGLLELEMGLRIFARPLHSSVAGVYAYHDEIGACVLLNRAHPRPRRRWTLAHELAHFLTTRREPSVSFSAKGKHPDDAFADAFAAAFLMPSSTVRRIFDEYVGETGRFSARHLILGAHRLRVSLEAFGRQLEQLELLPRGTYDSLRERGLDEEAVQRVLGAPLDGDLIEPGARLLLLAVEAAEKDIFSEGQLADMLAMDRLELRRAMDDFASMGATDTPLETR